MDGFDWLNAMPRVIDGVGFDGVPYRIALTSDEPFGHGGSAEIYKGVILGKDQRVVAVKFFRDYGMIRKEVQEDLLNRELRAARHIAARHDLLLPFLGTARAGRREAIVSLYMQNGNLMQYLESNVGCDKEKLIIQVAEAVNYLHYVEKIVHGDLKCENVLVSDTGNALLADFGLSRFLDVVKSVQTTATGVRRMYTVRFAAPELLDSEEEERNKPQSKTLETDVYAFGMLVLEAVTQEQPWANALPKSMRKSFVEITIINRVLGGQRPPQPTRPNGFVLISHPWWDVCTRCWVREPSHRPPMRSVLEVLKNTSVEPCHGASVYSVAYLPDGRVVSGSMSGTICIWDTLTGHPVIGPFRGHAGCVNSVAVSPDGRQVCTSAGDRAIRLWDAETCTPIGKPMIGHFGDVYGVAVCPDGTRIASCSADKTVRLWDAATGWPLGDPMVGHTKWVICVAFSPDGAYIASGSDDETIRIWDTTTGEALATLHPESTVFSVCFHPDGIYLVSGGSDGMVQIWNLTTLQLEHEWMGRSGLNNCVAVSPSGQYIASGAVDGKIRIWDANTGDAVGEPLVLEEGLFGNEWVLSVAFSPDGKSLVSGSSDGMVRVWDLFQ